MSDERLTSYAEYLVKNKDKQNTPEYRTVLQAYTAARGQVQTPKQPASPSFGPYVNAAAEYASRGGEAVVNAIRGPKGMPEAGQFPLNANTAFGLAMTNDPRAQEDIVKKNNPGVQTFPLEADGKRYTMAAMPGGQGGYINPPGLDVGDVVRFGAQASAFVPAAKWASAGKSLIGRGIKGFIGGAGTDVALQKGSQTMGSEQPTDLGQSAFVGAIGAALEPFAPMLKAAWRRVFSNQDNYNPRTGTLTENGVKVAKEAGLNPDEMNQRVSQEFGRLTREGTMEPEVAKRVAATTEFDLPATRGQLTQDYQQLNLEDRMRRGLEGEEAKGVLKTFDEQQTAALDKGNRYAQTQLSGRKAAAERPGESGQVLSEGLERRKSSKDAAVDDAYETARALDDTPGVGPFFFANEARTGIPETFKNALSESVVDEVLTPASYRALSDVQQLLAKPETLNLGTVETARRRLNKYIGTAGNKEDRANLVKMKSALDGWTHDTIAKGLFSGDEAILRQLEQARSLRAEVGRLFEGDDAGGKIIDNILNKAETPEQVVNYVFGASKLGGKDTTVSALRRLSNIVGKDSDEWGAIKEIAWMKLSRDKSGKPMSAEQFKKSWDEMNHQNKSLVNELFSINEQGLIRRYNEALQSTKRESTNAPQTAFALEAALRYTLRRFGQRESFTKGNVGSGAVLQFLARSPINPVGAASFARERQAVKAISPFDSPRRKAPILPATGEAAANQAEGR